MCLWLQHHSLTNKKCQVTSNCAPTEMVWAVKPVCIVAVSVTLVYSDMGATCLSCHYNFEKINLKTHLVYRTNHNFVISVVVHYYLFLSINMSHPHILNNFYFSIYDSTLTLNHIKCNYNVFFVSHTVVHCLVYLLTCLL